MIITDLQVDSLPRDVLSDLSKRGKKMEFTCFFVETGLVGPRLGKKRNRLSTSQIFLYMFLVPATAQKLNIDCDFTTD